MSIWPKYKICRLLASCIKPTIKRKCNGCSEFVTPASNPVRKKQERTYETLQ